MYLLVVGDDIESCCSVLDISEDDKLNILSGEITAFVFRDGRFYQVINVDPEELEPVKEMP